jgi:hypothetical protein
LEKKQQGEKIMPRNIEIEETKRMREIEEELIDITRAQKTVEDLYNKMIPVGVMMLEKGMLNKDNIQKASNTLVEKLYEAIYELGFDFHLDRPEDYNIYTDIADMLEDEMERRGMIS